MKNRILVLVISTIFSVQASAECLSGKFVLEDGEHRFVCEKIAEEPSSWGQAWTKACEYGEWVKAGLYSAAERVTKQDVGSVLAGVTAVAAVVGSAILYEYRVAVQEPAQVREPPAVPLRMPSRSMSIPGVN